MAAQSRGCFYTASRLLATILAVLFILVTPLVLLVFNLGQIAFNPATYKQALDRMDFYSQLPALAAGEIVDSAAKDPRQSPALAHLSKSDLQAILTNLIPRDWAKQQTESAIDQGFAWVNSDQATPQILISMTGVKQQIAGPAGTSALLQVINSWPPCTQAELGKAVAAIQSGDASHMPSCKPPEQYMAQVTSNLGDVAAQAAATIPDTIDLAAPNGQPPHIDPSQDPRPQLHLFRLVALLSPLILALVLAGITVLAVRSWKDLSRWWGIPLVVAAILGGLVALSMLPIQETFLQAIGQRTALLPSNLEDVVRSLLAAVFQAAGLWVGGESAVIGGAGLLLFLSGLFARGNRRSAT